MNAKVSQGKLMKILIIFNDLILKKIIISMKNLSVQIEGYDLYFKIHLIVYAILLLHLGNKLILNIIFKILAVYGSKQ